MKLRTKIRFVKSLSRRKQSGNVQLRVPFSRQFPHKKNSKASSTRSKNRSTLQYQTSSDIHIKVRLRKWCGARSAALLREDARKCLTMGAHYRSPLDSKNDATDQRRSGSALDGRDSAVQIPGKQRKRFSNSPAELSAVVVDVKALVGDGELEASESRAFPRKVW